VLLLQNFSSYMEEVRLLAASDPKLATEKLASLIRGIRIANGALTIPLSAYIGWVAARTLGSGRYPPEGIRLLKDTTVQEGSRARLIAIAYIGLALFTLSTNLVTWYLQVVLQALAQR
jgi:hypothetical protein